MLKNLMTTWQRMRGRVWWLCALLAWTSACALPLTSPSVTPSGSLTPMDAYRAAFESLTDRLADDEWDFHTAVRRRDTDAAVGAASRAADVLHDLVGVQVPSNAANCERELIRSVSDMLEVEGRLWDQRATGEAFPSEDDVELFFAFFGAEKPWIALLQRAEGMCDSPSA